jgi:DNA-binding NarL/FixJ family response regulator
MSSQLPKISIGYSSRLFADGLEAIIQNANGFNIAFTAPVGQELISHLENNQFEQILIIQVHCPGRKDVNLVHQLSDSFPFIKILFLSQMPRKRIGMSLFESGISGYLLKTCAKQDLVHAIHKIIENRPYFCSTISSHLVKSKKEEQEEEKYNLTEREKEVLSLLVSNYSNKQIASKLNLSENTIKTHRRNIHSKFGVSNLLGMVAHAYKSNLIDTEDHEICYGCPHVN